MQRDNDRPDVMAKSWPILSEATEALREKIESIATEIELSAGQTLFSQGDPGESLYLVDSGAIEISVLSPGGQKLWLNVMRQGDVFGEIALVDAGARTASAIALRASRLRRVRREDLFAAMRTQTDLAFDFIQLLSNRLRWVSLLLEDRAFLPLPVRLARRLLILGDKIGDLDGVVRVSQSDLADLVSASREGVAKVLATWRERGWVDISRNRIRLADRRALEGVAAAFDE